MDSDNPHSPDSFKYIETSPALVFRFDLGFAVFLLLLNDGCEFCPTAQIFRATAHPPLTIRCIL